MFKTRTKIKGYKVIKIKHDDGYTMCLEDMTGGPIISHMNEKECKSKFKRALNLMESVMKLLEFKKTGTFNYKNN